MATQVEELLIDEINFWPILKCLKDILKPLSDAVNIVQGDSVDYLKASKKIKDCFAKSIEAASDSCYGETIRIEIFKVRSSSL